MTITRDYWPTTGWRTAPPDQHGIDGEQLAATNDTLNTHYPHLDSFLVVRSGYLVAEYYRDSSGPDVLHNVKSVTKNVTSALTGIALQTGDLANLDETLGFLLPEAMSTVEDRHKRDITVRDLLTMRSGLHWEEWRGSTQQMTASPNWVRFVLEQPLAAAPGTAHNYSTGNTQILAALLQKSTSMNLLDYADLYLFGPLGIEHRTWPADPQGIQVGGAELALTARDMAKFGLLYLDGGLWDGAQLLPTTWVQDSHTPHANVISEDGEDCVKLDYGYQWWLRRQGPHASALAVGFGGQYVYVVPALDLVVVITGRLANVPESFRDNRMLCLFNVVQDHVVPAITTPS